MVKNSEILASIIKADELKERLMDLKNSTEISAARQKLHDHLEENPEMGPERYKTYLDQDGPDKRHLFRAR